MKMNYTESKFVINGEPITVFNVDSDMYGNSRYVVHFLALGVELKDYGKIPKLTKYRAKWFGGGYVFQSVNVREDLTWMLSHVAEYYNNKRECV